MPLSRRQLASSAVVQRQLLNSHEIRLMLRELEVGQGISPGRILAGTRGLVPRAGGSGPAPHPGAGTGALHPHRPGQYRPTAGYPDRATVAAVELRHPRLRGHGRHDGS